MAVTATDRNAPAQRFGELLGMYRNMQRLQVPPTTQVPSGQSLSRHGQNIKHLIDGFQAKSLLDYGSGKGAQYTSVRIESPSGQIYPSIPTYWGLDSITCFDPASEPYSRRPTEKFDGVVCTDVLKHNQREEMSWIIRELFSFANKFVYANIACLPVSSPSESSNEHCQVTAASTAWWSQAIAEAAAEFPDVRYFFFLEQASGQDSIQQTLVKG